MHGDAFAAGDVANDGLSANGIAAAGAINEHVALTFDADGAAVSAEDAADNAAESGVFFGGSGGGWFACGSELAQNLARGIFFVADCGPQIVGLAQAVVGGDALEVRVFNVFERNAIFAGLFVDQLFADFDGALALVNVQPVLDFVAGAGRTHYA